MSKARSGLFGLLALAGFGGIAMAFSGKAEAAKKPKDKTGAWIPADDLPASKRQWRLVWQGDTRVSLYDHSLEPKAQFQSGQTVKLQSPAGEPTDPNIDANRVHTVNKLRASRLYLQQPDGLWYADPSRGVNWSYELNTKTGDPPEPLVVDQAWLQPSDVQVAPDPQLVKQVAKVIAPVTAKQEAVMSLPLYPQGLVVSKGNVSGRVVGISKAGDTYHYKVEAGMGPFSQEYVGTESQVMSMLAEKTGQQPYGFAFPVGVTLTAKQYRVTISGRTVKDGKMFYTTDQGEMQEPTLILKLYQALK